jgi:hypothetical protein
MANATLAKHFTRAFPAASCQLLSLPLIQINLVECRPGSKHVVPVLEIPLIGQVLISGSAIVGANFTASEIAKPPSSPLFVSFVTDTDILRPDLGRL